MSTESEEDIDGYFSTARTAGRQEAVRLRDESYTEYLIDHDDPRLADFRGMGYQEFADDRYAAASFLRDLQAYWLSLYREPFRGITSDGVVEEGLYPLPDSMPLDPAPAGAVERFLATLTPEQVETVSYPIDAPQWRAWSNPEFVIHRVGLRLEELDEKAQAAALGVMEASLSPTGHARVVEAMELNGFLGDLVDLPRIMNARSYWFSVFGDPTAGGAWGWQLFGHHVAVNFVSVAGRHVVAPVFLGAEPALTDGARKPIFAEREALALQLAGSLTEDQAAQAVVYTSVLDPAMPQGRLHPADERHVAGAFRDNRVVPYEGIQVSRLSAEQQELVWRIVEDFLLLKDEQRRLTMETVRSHASRTWFSWYGALDGTEPTYLRIQSPVVLVELDHHAGVWLDNRLPARFHVHTTLRSPNGNDYGKAYLGQFHDAENQTDPAAREGADTAGVISDQE